MGSIAEFEQWIERPDRDFEAAPAARFLEVYNRQLRRALPAMEDWWVFGGFITELEGPEDRMAAEALLKCVMESDAPGSVIFDRLCMALEAYALPGWVRRMGADGAETLSALHPNQTGARLAALAALAEPLGWDVGADLEATGFASLITTWYFDSPNYGARHSIQVRAGKPRFGDAATSPAAIDFVVDIDFTLGQDEPGEAAMRRAVAQLVRLTEAAASSTVLVDLSLRRRLDALRRI